MKWDEKISQAVEETDRIVSGCDNWACGRCRFWNKCETKEGALTFGFCYRYPPTPIVTKSIMFTFPKTFAQEYCGEFRP